MAERTQQFWALCSNPDSYRIEHAVAEVEFDNWSTKGSKIQAGDRAIVWKAKGLSDTEGIVALAEMVANPSPAPDLHPEYQVHEVLPDEDGAIEEMVTLRYVSTPHLPLWIYGPHSDLLSSLSIVRGGKRRSVYQVKPEQWVALMKAVGGWPHPQQSADVQAIAKVLDQQVGKRRGGQGFQRDAELRRAVERRAMALAIEHYQRAGWQVEDVSAQQPYDLHCRFMLLYKSTEMRIRRGDARTSVNRISLPPKALPHGQARLCCTSRFPVWTAPCHSDGMAGS